ncbi:UNVERIFIED_CONTAM: hypothetical protein Slati_0464200 [Sesamum latifolium]|uniref:Uncharacterized protein n=1 Tax=Sesamum latifolium TaxID=2727402 RepID=A0AAW2Y0J3_9LAMI
MWRAEQLRKINDQVDRISREMQELRRPIEMGPRAPLEMDNVIVRTGSPYIPEILVETLGHNVKIPDSPKYYGETDPKEQLTAFDNILQLYGLSDALCYQIFITTLYGKAQE